jgi:hypothetical protein
MCAISCKVCHISYLKKLSKKKATIFEILKIKKEREINT